MKFETASGTVTLNQRSHFAKWLQGWGAGGGFTGASTVDAAWRRAIDIKPDDCSWRALGRLMASEQRFGKILEYDELLGNELVDDGKEEA